MTFLRPDPSRFPCLGLALRALTAGGTAPAALNAANEVAVGLFLGGKIPFLAIPDMIAEALDAHRPVHQVTLDEIVRADRETRESMARQAESL